MPKGWQGRCLKKCGEEGDRDGFEVCGTEPRHGGLARGSEYCEGVEEEGKMKGVVSGPERAARTAVVARPLSVVFSFSPSPAHSVSP